MEQERIRLVAVAIRWLKEHGYTIQPPPEIEFRGEAYRPDISGIATMPDDDQPVEVCVVCETPESLVGDGAMRRARALSRWTLESTTTRTIWLAIPERCAPARNGASRSLESEVTEPEIRSSTCTHLVEQIITYYDGCILDLGG